MIDTKELRLIVEAFRSAGQPMTIQASQMKELLDRLEAAEKDIALKERIIDSLGSELNAVANERDELRALVVMRFDHDYPPQFTQGHNLHELNEPVTAEHCRWFVAEIERLRTDCDALRAKVEAMERQRPVRFVFKSDELDEQVKRATDPIWAEAFDVPEGMVPLYALPGAKGE